MQSAHTIEAVTGDRLSRRLVAQSDHDFLGELFEESRPELALLPDRLRDQLVRLQFDSQLAGYRSTAPDALDWILLLDRDGDAEPVGRCYVEQARGEHRLLDLAISARFRGRGLGTAVIERLCADAARAGAPLRLSVWQANSGAVRLYRRLGFVADTDDAAGGALAVPTGYLSMRWAAEGGA